MTDSSRTAGLVRAAVVARFGSPPAYGSFLLPAADPPDHVLVDVLAAGLHPRVRSQAGGTHYTRTDQLPLVPGIDGVGRTADGQLLYFVLPDTPMGSMAERTVVDLRRSVPLPAGTDPVQVAAAMNPALSSWVALRRRVDFARGQSVLILGATGNAGQIAVQVARHLGAGHVVAAGRDRDRLDALEALGADETVRLTPDPRDSADALGRASREVDVVLDYLWGEPTAAAIEALVTHRADRRRPLTWVELGSAAGLSTQLPAAALRAARLQLVGSGQGSVGTQEIVDELPALVTALEENAFRIDARPVPLADCAWAWDEAVRTRERIVLTP